MNLKNKSVYFSLIIVGVLFYLLNRLSLFINDDYFYSLIGGSTSPIESISDIIQSQTYDYMHKNGRFLTHCLVQLFCGILGMNIFAYLNSLMFVFLLWISLNCLGKTYAYKNTSVLLIFLFLFSISGMPYVFLNNISCGINYLWTACFVLLYINIYSHVSDSKLSPNVLQTGMYFIFAILVGSMQESFSLGMSGALFIHFCLHTKDLNKGERALILGLWIGTIVVSLSPANLIRFTREGGGIEENMLMAILTRVYTILVNAPIVSLLLLVLSISLCVKKKITLDFIHTNYLWLCSIVINSLFVIFIAYTGKHQLTSISLFALIILMKWILAYHGALLSAFGKYITRLAFLFLCILYIFVYKYRHDIYIGHNQLVEAVSKSKDGLIVAPTYVKCCAQRSNWIARNFTRQEIYKDFSKKGVSLWLTRGNKDNLVTSILPDEKENLIKMCCESNKVNNCFFKTSDGFYFILRISNDENAETKQVQVEYKPNVASTIKGILKHTDSIIREERNLAEFECFKDMDYVYYVVYDDNPDRRILNMNVL